MMVWKRQLPLNMAIFWYPCYISGSNVLPAFQCPRSRHTGPTFKHTCIEILFGEGREAQHGGGTIGSKAFQGGASQLDPCSQSQASCRAFLIIDFSPQFGEVHTTKYGLMRIFKEMALVLGKFLVGRFEVKSFKFRKTRCWECRKNRRCGPMLSTSEEKHPLKTPLLYCVSFSFSGFLFPSSYWWAF